MTNQLKINYRFISNYNPNLKLSSIIVAMLLDNLQSVKALLILDNNGDRVLTKYYDDFFPSLKDKQEFEKNLFKKTDKTDFEIIAIQGLTVVYKSW